jgi:hypothetical protein
MPYCSGSFTPTLLRQRFSARRPRSVEQPAKNHQRWGAFKRICKHSIENHPAIHMKQLSCHKSAFVTGQKVDAFGNISWLSNSA